MITISSEVKSKIFLLKIILERSHILNKISLFLRHKRAVILAHIRKLFKENFQLIFQQSTIL